MTLKSQVGLLCFGGLKLCSGSWGGTDGTSSFPGLQLAELGRALSQGLGEAGVQTPQPWARTFP